MFSKIHNIHHESQLSVIDIEECDEYYIKKILNEKIKYYQKHYLIK
ncbi:hypothetical protein ACJ72_08000 [Emergomyces africanus]|uniref:Uncharacterized protein n=1 Tax=Emergomyces africanus TaxID=1955775 RepID=A0A1B7NLQ0_9EURO|nr:hypothetical protein ACJ72_08000 [Emergomyces africanus]